MTPSTLPLLVEHPIRHDDGALQLVLPGRAPIALTSRTEPVAGFNDGWQAESLFTLFDPLWVLVLRHHDGNVACWYVDSDGLLAAGPNQHPEPERRAFAQRLQPVALWLDALSDATIRIPVPDAVRAYAVLPPVVRRELDALLEDRRPTPDTPVPRDILDAEPAPILFEPVDGTHGYLVGNAGTLVPMALGDALAELQPGWRLEQIQTVFAPLLTVRLRHEDGLAAAWFIDLKGQVIGHHVDLLPAPYKRHVLQIASPLLDRLWAGVALGRPVPPDTVPDPVGGLQVGDLSALLPSYLQDRGEVLETRTWALDTALPPGLVHVIPTERGLRACDEPSLVKALAHPIHGEMERLLQSGRMCWPSPLDGSMLDSDGFALLLDTHCFAYRFRDDPTGLVFHVICTGIHVYNYGIYFPTANLLVARTTDMATACLNHLRHGRETILQHLLVFRDQLAEGSRIAPDETIQQYFGASSIHIGHYVWQDLSGLAYLLRQVTDTRRLPHLQLFDHNSTHRYFGPEERIFPMFTGRLTRHAVTFAAYVGEFYRRNQRVITYTAISVPAELRGFVRAAADATPELRTVCKAADAARARPAPVILLGIRVGNRTMDDMEAFAADLLGHLGRAFPGCTVILDGLNDDADRGRDVPDPAPGSDLEEEFRIGRALQAVADEAGVRFVDNLNRSALRSAVWCSRADCFIAPLGAALAKYRWICNTPGLALTSRWNLEHRGDLHIYDSPAALEGSSEMLFNRPDEVRDLTPERDAGGHDGRGNFIVERAPIFARFTDLVQRHVALRPATTDPITTVVEPVTRPAEPPAPAIVAPQPVSPVPESRRKSLLAWIRRTH